MTKTLDIDDGTNSLTLGGVEVRENWNNELEFFKRPDQVGGSPETRALNLNRIKHVYDVSAEFDDEVADKLNSGISTKEDAKSRLYTIAESTNLVTFTYGSETVEGFLSQISVKENASDDATSYTVQFQLLKCTEMTS